MKELMCLLAGTKEKPNLPEMDSLFINNFLESNKTLVR